MSSHQNRRNDSPARREHLLAVVEPATRGETTLELARDVCDRGGNISVLMLFTARVQHDISDFAASEELDYTSAEARAIDQFAHDYTDWIDGVVRVDVARVSSSRFDITRYVDDDITAVAVPSRVLDVQQLAGSIDRPLIVVPPVAV